VSTEPPEYNVYRSKRGLLDRFRRDEPDGLRELRQRDSRQRPRARRPFSWGRAVKWLVVAIVAWVLISVVAFFVSAELSDHVSGRTKAALTPGGSMFSGSTVLVLGSDARPEGSKEPGAGGPGRADSIMLMRVAFGSVRKLSILRDSYAEIPGHGSQKINAAYALGGAPLMIQTVERFVGGGLRVNHVLEVNFDNFPKLINALGGIDVELKRCISAPAFGGRRFILHKGKNHLNGRQALAFARVRKNRCARSEDDRARAKRQQQMLSAIRDRALSPAAFARLPVVAWSAPRTVRTDLHGPGLAMLMSDLTTSPGGTTRVLLPSGSTGSALVVSPDARARAARYLLR
jgi:LCP family protein required for cell wall assembly